MDLNSIIALGIFGIAALIISFKMLTRYLKHEQLIVTSDQKSNYENKISTLEKDFASMENSRDGYRQKVNWLRNNSDILFDDDELLDDPGVESDSLIPSIAEALFPKMPKKLKELLGKDEFQGAIFKIFEKNPDKVTDWVTKYFSKKDETETTTPKLKEKYL